MSARPDHRGKMTVEAGSQRDLIIRAHALADRLLAQVADGDLPMFSRELAERRAIEAIQTARGLERGLRL